MAEFRPLPFLRNPHCQTILGTVLNDLDPGITSRRRMVVLPDGDKLLIYDTKNSKWQPPAPIAILVHGLSGCHRSGYLIRLGRLLRKAGYRIVRIDLRGAGEGIYHARKTYNAGSSDDVRAVVEEVHSWSPESPIVAVGYSLGGNIILKMAGESVTKPLHMLRAIAAVNPPIDLTACCQMLSQPSNRFYDRYFVRALVKIAKRHKTIFPDLPDLHFPEQMTLRDFDNLHTAPRGGYADADDYYRRASSLPLIKDISIPTLLITAEDDPFVAIEPFKSLPDSPSREVRIVPHGGHLGFLGLNGHGGFRWAEPQVAKWIINSLLRTKFPAVQ